MSEWSLTMIAWVSGLWVGIGAASIETNSMGGVLMVAGALVAACVIYERIIKCL